MVDTSRAESIVSSSRAYLDEHHDEISAIQILTEAGDGHVAFADVRELADRISRPPHNWTTDLIWNANVALEGRPFHRSVRHTLTELIMLRLPTGIFYAQGVKANVLFFDNKPPPSVRGPDASGCTTCVPTSTSP